MQLAPATTLDQKLRDIVTLWRDALDDLEALSLALPRNGNQGTFPLVGDLIECVISAHLGPGLADLEALLPEMPSQISAIEPPPTATSHATRS